MTSALSHPLVSAYLRDLDLLLHGVEPGERSEVLAGVHEHLDASLLPGASDEDVRRSLAELGSPQSVADEAYAGRLAFRRHRTCPLGPPPRRSCPAVGCRWSRGSSSGWRCALLVSILGAGGGYSTTSMSSS